MSDLLITIGDSFTYGEGLQFHLWKNRYTNTFDMFKGKTSYEPCQTVSETFSEFYEFRTNNNYSGVLGKLLNTIKSVQKIHNSNLDIEGLLLTMFDSRLRLSNQVVEEVQKHFHDMVFETIIQRNVKLSEAPSYGESIINYDATSKGANNYLRLAEEIIKKNSN